MKENYSADVFSQKEQKEIKYFDGDIFNNPDLQCDWFDTGNPLFLLLRVKGHAYYLISKESNTVLAAYSYKDSLNSIWLGKKLPIELQIPSRLMPSDNSNLRHMDKCEDPNIKDYIWHEDTSFCKYIYTAYLLNNRFVNKIQTKEHSLANQYKRYLKDEHFWDPYQGYKLVDKLNVETIEDAKVDVPKFFEQHHPFYQDIIDKFKTAKIIDSGRARYIYKSDDSKYIYKKCGDLPGYDQQITEIYAWFASPLPIFVPLEMVFRADDGQIVLVYPYLENEAEDFETIYDVANYLTRNFSENIFDQYPIGSILIFYNNYKTKVWSTGWRDYRGFKFLADYGEFFDIDKIK